MLRIINRARVLVISGLLLAIPLTVRGQSHPPNFLETLEHRFMIRADPADHEQLALQYELNLLRSPMSSPDLVLVEAPTSISPEAMEALLLADPAILDVEPVRGATLPSLLGAPGQHDVSDVMTDLLRTGSSPHNCWLGSPELWEGYGDQQSAIAIRLPETRTYTSLCGAGVTVAIIDTGVDPEHELLKDVLVHGYDFVHGEAGFGSEWRMLDQSVTAIVEQSVTAIVEQSEIVMLAGQAELMFSSNAVAPIATPTAIATLEGLDLPPFFGHGTMVAGLVRLVAPQASIMPLQVFDANGAAQVYDIVDAIYYAVDHGADVINMSFSLEEPSRELRRALKYARDRNVVCVAAAGNQGERTQVYPAGHHGTMGIAATTADDELSPFSNFGPQLVTIAAPGSGVVSSYPGGLLAAGWGTSFSTPLVAGTAALLRSVGLPGWVIKMVIRETCEPIEELHNLIGKGRLDTYSATAWLEN